MAIRFSVKGYKITIEEQSSVKDDDNVYHQRLCDYCRAFPSTNELYNKVINPNVIYNIIWLYYPFIKTYDGKLFLLHDMAVIVKNYILFYIFILWQLY